MTTGRQDHRGVSELMREHHHHHHHHHPYHHIYVDGTTACDVDLLLSMINKHALVITPPCYLAGGSLHSLAIGVDITPPLLPTTPASLPEAPVHGAHRSGYVG